MDQHGQDMLARRAAVLVVRTVARTVCLDVVQFGTAGNDREPIVFHLDVAALRQGEGLAEPLRVVLRAQRLSGLRTEALPGHEGVVFVAVQGGDVVGQAGGDGVW
jgi:hypothetical protein